uniref:universal stress protein n=1 Tax=Trichocoleus desertorum TaxID=1481672 RepID=UPI0028F40768|nr:universal stress protein [Trichocoleus desertorum]
MPMLVRLQGALGSTDLIDQILLLPQRPKGDRSSGKLHLPGRTRRAAKRHVQANHASEVASGADAEINLVVGYNSSPKSQTALDLTLWIAHQTRLATRRQVTVQVVYVINPADCLDSIPTTTDFRQVRASKKSAAKRAAQMPTLGSGLALESDSYSDTYSDSATLARVGAIATLDEPTLEDAGLPLSKYPMGQAQQFEQADQILWQARCLANEWRGSLKTHLRFGQVAQELRSVAKAESAVLLWLGCDSPKNPIVRSLSANSPCPVLGVPPALHPDRYFDA